VGGVAVISCGKDVYESCLKGFGKMNVPMKRRFACAFLLAFVGVFSFTLARPESAMVVQPLPSPAGASSTEPQFTIQGDRVILSWLLVAGKRATLKFAERISSGWSVPQTVISSSNFFVNAYDVPSVRVLPDGTLVAHWIENNGPEPDATNVRLSWSRDKGRTWSKPVSPHHDGTETEHGFASLFPAQGAAFGLVWIDGRATDPEKETGDMSLRSSVYSPDGKQIDEQVVKSRVCECCSTAAAETSEGVIVAFRNRSTDEVRNIYVSRFVAGHWSTPTAVHDDAWRIDACPINGPAVSASGRDVAVAWFDGKDDKGRAFVAFSHDAGRTFGSAIRIDDASSLGRLGVQMLGDGSAAVTYIEFTNNHSQFRVRRISPAGARSAPVTIADTSGSRYPRVARDRNELLFSWTDTANGSSQVRTARATY
jgi:hypothetical protein